MSEIDLYLDTIKATLLSAGEIIREGFSQKKVEFSHKGDVDLVTEWDIRTERAIKEKLLNKFPDSRVLGEESGGSYNQGGITWIVDPIDGTTNFVHRIPYCGTSIACLDRGKTIAGGFFAPMLDNMYLAGLGQGAFKNDSALKVSETSELKLGIMATGFAYDRKEQIKEITAFVSNAMKEVQGIRRFGSAALDLCMVAEGIFDLYMEKGIYAWDIGAGELLVREAGGEVSDYAGEKLDIFMREIVATNGKLHHQAVDKLNVEEKDEVEPKYHSSDDDF